MKKSSILKVLTVGVVLVILFVGNGKKAEATVRNYGYQNTSSRCYKPCYKPVYKPCYNPCYKPVYKPCYNPCYKPVYKPCYKPCYPGGGGTTELSGYWY